MGHNRIIWKFITPIERAKKKKKNLYHSIRIWSHLSLILKAQKVRFFSFSVIDRLQILLSSSIESVDLEPFLVFFGVMLCLIHGSGLIFRSVSRSDWWKSRFLWCGSQSLVWVWTVVELIRTVLYLLAKKERDC